MSDKPKILLAVGERGLEHILKEELSGEFKFVKEASYREIVITRIREHEPDIVLLREALKGSMAIDNLALDIRETFPDVRIVFYTRKYRPGEPLLRKLVSYGVYDFISGESVTKKEIFEALRSPKQLSDVRQYLEAPVFEDDEPKINITTEYKDLSKEPKEEPKIVEIEVPVEAPKKKKNLLGKIFGSKKKDKKEKTKAKEAETAIEIDENTEEETSFWEEDNTETLYSEEFSETIEDIEEDIPTNPLPLFNQPIAKSDEGNEKLPGEQNAIASQVVEEEATEADETNFDSGTLTLSDLRENKKAIPSEEIIRQSINEENVIPEPVIVERKPEEKEKLTIPVRGKPNTDDVSLHQRNQMNHQQEQKEPEIDFNPYDLGMENIPTTYEAHPQTKQEKVDNPISKVPQKEKRADSLLNGWMGGKDSPNIKVQNKQIITFVGATHGIGNTHVAFNTATLLAKEGNRVLYIEAHSSFSSIDFSLQLGSWQQGIDKALADIEYNNGMNISEHIVRIEELRKNTSRGTELHKIYKPLPSTLDYMFYSQDYQTLSHQHEVPKERLKDLVMYLIARENYDVIVVDSEPIGNLGVDGLLNISNKIYFTMTQDPGKMGVFHRQFEATKNRVNITENRYLIVNQFINTEPTIKDIQEWTNEKVLQTIPFTHKEVVHSNYLGIPFILKTKDKSAIDAFYSLIQHVAE